MAKRTTKRARAEDGTFPQSPMMLAFLDTEESVDDRKSFAITMVEHAASELSRKEVLDLVSTCLDAAVAVGERTVKDNCLAAIDATIELRRALVDVISAMNTQGASPEMRATFPTGRFPPVFAPNASPLVLQAQVTAAPAVRGLAAVVEIAAQVMAPLREPLEQMAEADNQRANARELAFATALKREAARDRRITPLLNGRTGYLLAAACGLVSLPATVAEYDVAINTWMKRLTAGKNSKNI